MTSNFDEASVEFRQFLDRNGYPPKTVWVTPHDVLLSGDRLIYVRVPVPPANEEHARRMFDLSLVHQRGILFGTVFAIEDTTYAFAWEPDDAVEGEHSLMNNGLKMSARIGTSKVQGEIVQNALRWSYLDRK